MKQQNVMKLIEALASCDKQLSTLVFRDGEKVSISGLAVEVYMQHNKDMFEWHQPGLLRNIHTNEMYTADMPDQVLEWYGFLSSFEERLSMFKSFKEAATWLVRIKLIEALT